jgi:hypothetical protein
MGLRRPFACLRSTALAGFGFREGLGLDVMMLMMLLQLLPVRLWLYVFLWYQIVSGCRGKEKGLGQKVFGQGGGVMEHFLKYSSLTVCSDVQSILSFSTG